MTEERGVTALGDLEERVARHGAMIEGISARMAEDRISNDQKFVRVDDKLNTADAKLDRLLEAQRTEIEVRRSLEIEKSNQIKKVREDKELEARELEKRQDKRAKKLAVISAAGSGLVVTLLGEVFRSFLRKHGL